MNNEQWQEYRGLVMQGMDPSEAHGCIMAVRNAPFEYVPAEEQPDADPFEWGLEGKPERKPLKSRTGPNPSLTPEAPRIESCGLVSGFTPAWVYIRNPGDAHRRVEEWD